MMHRCRVYVTLAKPVLQLFNSAQIVFVTLKLENGRIAFSEELAHPVSSFQLLSSMVSIYFKGKYGSRSVPEYRLMDSDWHHAIEFSPNQPRYNFIETASADTPGAIRPETIHREKWFDGPAAFATATYAADDSYAMTPDAVIEYLHPQSESKSAVSVGSLTQSSGWGKSMLLKEICKAHRAPYMSFPADKAVPRSTKFIDHHLAREFSRRPAYVTVQRLRIVLAAFLDYISQHASHLNGSDFFNFFFSDEFSLSLDTQVQEQEMLTKALLSSSVQNYKRKMGVKYVLLLVDEAAWLLEDDLKSSEGITGFRLFRRALRVEGITGLFAATNAAVQNFVPALHWESADSLKDDEEENGEDEIVDIPISQGLCNVGPMDLNVVVPWVAGLELDQVFDPRRLAAYGRPLWSGMIRCALPLDSNLLFQKLADFAEKKLQTNMVTGHVAAVLCVVNFMGMNPGRLTDTLVKSHMATLRGISADRCFLFATYISEPFLHVAALRIIERHQEILPTYRNYLAQGLIGIGYVGEIVARLVLALSRLPNIRDVVSLRDYTRSVSGLLLPGGSNDFVSLTHWVTWDAEVSQECLFDAFLRTAGLITTRNEQAIDLIIPVAQVRRTRRVEVRRMTAILVQVKTRQTVVNTTNLFVSMERSPVYTSLRQCGVKPYCWIIQKAGGPTDQPQSFNRLEMKFRDLAPNLPQWQRKIVCEELLDIHVDAPALTLGDADKVERSNKWRDLTATGCQTTINGPRPANSSETVRSQAVTRSSSRPVARSTRPSSRPAVRPTRTRVSRSVNRKRRKVNRSVVR